MIRWILGAAFLRHGVVGVLVALLALAAAGWWLLSSLWWLISGAVWVFGFLAGLGYLLLLIQFLRWLRRRRIQDHLLMHGRRHRDW